MPKSLAILLLATSVGLAAPIPKGPSPDPLGKGYIGFYPIDTNSLVIDRVDPGSPAAKAGLQSGDEFVQVGTFKPFVFEQLRGYVTNFRPGTDIKIVVRRRGELKALNLRLGARPADADFGRGFPVPIDPEP